jgi:hypothetical protein
VLLKVTVLNMYKCVSMFDLYALVSFLAYIYICVCCFFEKTHQGSISLNHVGGKAGILCTEKRAPKLLVKRPPGVVEDHLVLYHLQVRESVCVSSLVLFRSNHHMRVVFLEKTHQVLLKVT